MKIKQVFACLIFASIASGLFLSPSASASRENIISDGVFGNEDTMTEIQIQNFINAFPNSCLKPQNYPAGLSPVTFKEPLDYFNYGSDVSPARIIYKVSKLYHLNPQVILTTLEKEQNLVTGGAGCAVWKYNSAMGYNCPDGSENSLSNYPSIGVSNTCVKKESNVTFSRQVNHASWQLRFDKERAYGNTSWGDDGSIVYVGFMTQGNRARYAGGPVQYYDGRAIIDGQSIQLANGSTAALYNYTPHFNSFERIFTSWFGSTTGYVIPGCVQATNTSLSCVWELISTSDQHKRYEIDYGTAQSLINSGNYNYSSFAFISRNPFAPSAGNIPVYSVTVGSGMLLTADLNEYNTLQSLGYQVNGIVFYADPAGSNSGYPVYRLSGPTGHVFTTSNENRNSLLAQGFSDEGVAFNALSPVKQETAAPAGKTLVYRFGGMPSGRHFWTTDVYERDSMIVSGYIYEGVAWLGSATMTSVPVYRLSTPVLNKHLFTDDENEKNVLSASPDWKYEGVAWYQNPSASASPVFRLYLRQNAENFLTADSNERSVLIRTGVGNDEGIAWYQ